MECNYKQTIQEFVDVIEKESGYDKYKDALLNFIKKTMDDTSNPFSIIIGGTSMGKTHGATVATANYCFENQGKKVIGISIKHGNALNIELLEEMNNGYLKDSVLYLKSNFENITREGQKERIKKFILSLPKEETEIKETGETLVSIISTWEGFEKEKNAIIYRGLGFVEDRLMQDIDNADKKFREAIRKYVYEHMTKEKTLPETIKKMLSLKYLDVLSDIYPQLTIFDKKVVLCTLAKFVRPIDFIVCSYTSLVDSPFVDKDTVAFLDEIDEAYRTLLNEIVEKATQDKNEMNCFNTVQAIAKGVVDRKNFDLIKKSKKLAEMQAEFDNIKINSEKIFNFMYGNTEYDISNYRIFDCTDEKGGKIFYSHANGRDVNVQYLGDENGKIKYRINSLNHCIEIYIDDTKDGVLLNGFLNEIRNIYENIKNSIFVLAHEYYEENKSDHLDWTKKIALTTVLNYLISNNDAAVSYSDALYNEFLSFYDSDNFEKVDILSNDFFVYELRAHKEIKEDLMFNVIECYDTPEKALCRIIEKAGKTVAMSATAEIKSVMCNFNWDAICEYLNIEYEDIADIPEEILKLKKALEFMQSKNEIKTTFISEKGTKDEDRKKHIKELKKNIKEILNSDRFNELYSPDKEGLKSFIDKTMQTDTYGTLEQERGLSALYALLLCMKEKYGMSGMIFLNNGINEDDAENSKAKIFNFVKVLNAKVLPKDKQISYCVLKKLKADTLDNEIEKMFHTENGLAKNSAFIYFTTYGSFATGGNPYVPITVDDIDFTVDLSDETKNFYAKIPDLNRLKPVNMKGKYGGRTDLMKADIDFIYLEKKSHLYPMVDDTLKSTELIKNKKMVQTLSLYYYNSIGLSERSKINPSDKEIYKQVTDIMRQGISSKNKNNCLKKLLLENDDIVAHYILTIIQALGRLPRNPVGSKHFRIFLQTGKFDDVTQNFALGFCELEKYGFHKEMAETLIVKSIQKQIENENMVYGSKIDESICEIGDTIRNTSLKALSEYRLDPVDEKIPQIYNYIKNGLFAKYPTMPKSMFDKLKSENPIFDVIGDILYMKNISGAYKYKTDGKKTDMAHWIMDSCENKQGSIFSREELAVDCFNKLLGEEFIHYDESDEFIISPAFADMIKGDGAEKVVFAIPVLKDKICVLEDSDTEIFDMKIIDKPFYFDIKNHNHCYDSMADYMEKEIHKFKNKLHSVKGKAVLFLNMHPSDNFNFNDEYGKIKFLDGLIRKDGSICEEALNILITYLIEYKGE